jgi:hypothetical protein
MSKPPALNLHTGATTSTEAELIGGGLRATDWRQLHGRSRVARHAIVASVRCMLRAGKASLSCLDLAPVTGCRGSLHFRRRCSWNGTNSFAGNQPFLGPAWDPRRCPGGGTTIDQKRAPMRVVRADAVRNAHARRGRCVGVEWALRGRILALRGR